MYSNMITTPNTPPHLRTPNTTALLKKLRVKVMDWPSMSPDLNPIEHLWGILKWKVTTQNIDTLGPIWTFSLRGVLTFVASGLDINGCVLSCFEETANVHCYTSCTLTTLHCSKVSFLQCCHMKRYNKIFTKIWGCTHFWKILYVRRTLRYCTLYSWRPRKSG